MQRSELEDIVRLALACGLIGPQQRRGLLEGLPVGYIYSLPTVSRPIDQLRFDLMELQRTPRLIGLDRPPLAVWLSNAAEHCAGEGRAEAADFARWADAVYPPGKVSARVGAVLVGGGPRWPDLPMVVLTMHPDGRHAPYRIEPKLDIRTTIEIDTERGRWAVKNVPHGALWRRAYDDIERKVEETAKAVGAHQAALAIFAIAPPALGAHLGALVDAEIPGASVVYFEQTERSNREWQAWGPAWSDMVGPTGAPVLVRRGHETDERDDVDVALIVEVGQRHVRRAVDIALASTQAQHAVREVWQLDAQAALDDPAVIEQAVADLTGALRDVPDRHDGVKRLHLFYLGPVALLARAAPALRALGPGISAIVYTQQAVGYAPAMRFPALCGYTLGGVLVEPDDQIARPNVQREDIFLTASEDDEERARAVHERLVEEGYAVFYQPVSLTFGDSFDTQVPAAQQRARATVLLISPHTEQSWYQRDEIVAATRLGEDGEQGTEQRVYPVLLDDLDRAAMPKGLGHLTPLRCARDASGDEIGRQIAAAITARLPPRGERAAAAPRHDAATPEAADASPTPRAETPSNAPLEILLLAAHPDQHAQRRLQEEARDIEDAITVAQARGRVTVSARFATRHQEVLALLRQAEPHIVHFTGHATDSGIFLVNRQTGQHVKLDPRAVLKLLQRDPRLRGVVLTSNDTAALAAQIGEAFDFAVGVNGTVRPHVARDFARAFYESLAGGATLEAAFDDGQVVAGMRDFDEGERFELHCAADKRSLVLHPRGG